VGKDPDAQWLLMPIRGADPRAPLVPDLPLEGVTGAEGDPIRPVMVRGGGGRRRLLLFTSTESLRRWRPVARFVSAPRQDLLALAGRLGAVEVVLDAAGPNEKHLPAGGSGRRPSPPSDPWEVRALASPVEAARLFRLRRRLAQFTAVFALYLFEVTVDGQEVLAAGFEVQGLTDEGSRAAVRAAARDIGPLLPVDLYAGAQFILLSDARLAERARAVDAPVYVRAVTE